MKKTYTKPEISFESFLMSTNIAGDCGTIIDTESRNNCAYVLRSGHHVFLSNLSSICDTTEYGGDSTVDGEYNGFCYHVPTEGKVLFNS